MEDTELDARELAAFAAIVFSETTDTGRAMLRWVVPADADSIALDLALKALWA